jgi:hypothetical protein
MEDYDDSDTSLEIGFLEARRDDQLRWWEWLGLVGVLAGIGVLLGGLGVVLYRAATVL